MRVALRRIVPGPILEALRHMRRTLRRVQFQVRRFRKVATINGRDIKYALEALGVSAGEDVLVHSSLRGLGVVTGGAEAIVRALREVVGVDGTLLVPAYPLRGTMYDHLRHGGIALDARTTQSTMGQISETVRRRPGSCRSLHPTHSVAAWGPRAEWYCSGHEASITPCGPGSPFAKLIERHGWILALGSPIGKITSYHRLEDTARGFPVDIYLNQLFEARVIDSSGREQVVRVKCHDPRFSAHRIDNNRAVEAVFERLLSEAGVLRVQRLGTGRASAMRADALQAVLERLLERGITIYGVQAVSCSK